MSRRNQSTRRRSYGRRQHEVRERRPSSALDEAMNWLQDISDSHDQAAAGSHPPEMLDMGRDSRAAA